MLIQSNGNVLSFGIFYKNYFGINSSIKRFNIINIFGIKDFDTSIETQKFEINLSDLLTNFKTQLIKDSSFQNNEISVILMHGFMQKEDKKSSVDIVKEVSDFFYKKIEFLKENDIDLSKVILDPGIGFGKTFEENIELIKTPQKICNNEFPVLMALSRKRCIGAMTNKEVEDRLVGTISANVFSVINGAKIIRVHDVWQAIDSMNVLKYML
jgi:dihydropteroate synthase